MEYFGRCYEICSHLDNAAALYSARVQYGIAKGHKFMGEFSALVTEPSADGLQQLAAWKDARVVVQPPQSDDGEVGELEGGEEERSSDGDEGGTVEEGERTDDISADSSHQELAEQITSTGTDSDMENAHT